MCPLSVLSAEYLSAENFPEHIKSLVQKEKESEEQEKRQREIERNTCKVHGPFGSTQDLLFCFLQLMYFFSFTSSLTTMLSGLLPSDKAFLHASCKDDDGEQAGSTQGQNSERSDRDGIQGLFVFTV